MKTMTIVNSSSLVSPYNAPTANHSKHPSLHTPTFFYRRFCPIK